MSGFARPLCPSIPTLAAFAQDSFLSVVLVFESVAKFIRVELRVVRLSNSRRFFGYRFARIQGYSWPAVLLLQRPGIVNVGEFN